MPFHHKVEEGLLTCSDCHNPHGTFGRKSLSASVQQDAICTHRAGLHDLIRLNHEVLAQHWKCARGASFGEMRRAALKEFRIGKH